MIDYNKIGIISIRILGISFIFSGILELLMIFTSLVLAARGTVPPETLAQEVWYVQAVCWLMGGTFLYARSRSLDRAVVERLFPGDELVEKESQTSGRPKHKGPKGD